MAKDTPTQPAEVTPALTRDLEGAMYLEGGEEGTSEEMALAIVARILSATTVEEIFAGPQSLLSAEDVINVPFMLHDIEFRPSDYKVGPKAFGLLHITREGGEMELVTCGARNVMAAAFAAKQRGFLPKGGVAIVEGKETRSGFTPLWLTLASNIPEGQVGKTPPPRQRETLAERNERLIAEEAKERESERAFT